MSNTSVPLLRVARSIAYVVFGAMPATVSILYGLGGLVMSAVLIPQFLLISFPWFISGLYGTIVIWKISFFPASNGNPVHGKIIFGLLIGFLAYMPFLWVRFRSVVHCVKNAINNAEYLFSNFNHYSFLFLEFLWSVSPIFIIFHYLISNYKFLSRHKFLKFDEFG